MLVMKISVKTVLSAIIFLGLAVIAIGLYLYNKQDKDLQKEKPDFILTSIELQKAFEENETLSIEKYVNKIIEVTGTILSVTAGDGNITNIALETDSDYTSVICTLTSGSEPTVLVPGNEIRIRGECSGFLMDVLLNNCVIIK
jgi:hypothetical protein